LAGKGDELFIKDNFGFMQMVFRGQPEYIKLRGGAPINSAALPERIFKGVPRFIRASSPRLTQRFGSRDGAGGDGAALESPAGSIAGRCEMGGGQASLRDAKVCGLFFPWAEAARLPS